MLAGFGLIGGATAIDTASAEPGRRLCVYGTGLASSGSADIKETFMFLDFKKDDDCPAVDESKRFDSFFIPQLSLELSQPVRKIRCEDLAAEIAKLSIVGANFDPFPDADACTLMTDDHFYSFKWDEVSKRQIETDQMDKGHVSQWQ